MRPLNIPLTTNQWDSIKETLIIVIGSIWFPFSLVMLYYFIDGTLITEENALLAIVTGFGLVIGWVPTLHVIIRIIEEVHHIFPIMLKEDIPVLTEEGKS